MDEKIRCAVTLTASSGVLLDFGTALAAVDALHDDEQWGWSTLTPERLPGAWEIMEKNRPGLFLATHSHEDHWSPQLWDEAQRRFPDAVFVSPEGGGRTVRPLGGSFGFSVGELTVEARRLPHEGREYADTVNWGFLLTCGGFTVLHAGDCAVGAPELASLLDGREPDLAILDFPWFTLSRGRRFTEETVRPKHLLLCHLPFAEDDSEGYRPAAAAAAQRTSSIDDVRCLMEPFQREVYI